MAGDRTAKFWFRNITSAPGEPPTSTKNSASISSRSLISVSRLFRTRAAPARRRLRRSGSSLKRAGAAAQVRKYGPVNGPFRHRGQSTQPAVNFLRVSLEPVESLDHHRAGRKRVRVLGWGRARPDNFGKPRTPRRRFARIPSGGNDEVVDRVADALHALNRHAAAMSIAEEK